jgi:hypothetical protein
MEFWLSATGLPPVVVMISGLVALNLFVSPQAVEQF